MTRELLLSLLEDPAIGQVLDFVARNHRVALKDLWESLETKGLEKEDISRSLERLKAADLIEEQDAPVEDFKIYYLTADGLATQRQLRRLQLVADTRAALKSAG